MKNLRIKDLRCDVGNVCRDFRKHTLKITLETMNEVTGINIKTLSAFENGNSSNLNIMLAYFNLARSEDEQKEFAEHIFNVI